MSGPTWSGIRSITRVPASMAKAASVGHRQWVGLVRSSSRTGWPVARRPRRALARGCTAVLQTPALGPRSSSRPDRARHRPSGSSASSEFIEVSCAEAQQSLAMTGSWWASVRPNGGSQVSGFTVVLPLRAEVGRLATWRSANRADPRLHASGHERQAQRPCQPSLRPGRRGTSAASEQTDEATDRRRAAAARNAIVSPSGG